MKHQISRILLAASLLCCGARALTACGSEDDLAPDYKNPSANFQPAADDQSEEARLRRQFFGTTGSYLLFNDTIQREFLGVDINGDSRYFVETVDLGYAIGTSVTSGISYSYTYLSSIEQKQQLTDFLLQYVQPHLTGVMRPYSWLVANVVTSYSQNSMGSTSVSRVYAAANQRCIAVAGNYLIQQERTDAQRQTYAQRILNIIIGQLAMNRSEAFGDFYKYSANYYSTDYSRAGFDGQPSASELRQLGFLSSTSSTSFPSMTNDLNTYATLVVQNTEEQLAKTYAAYPLVLQKAAVVRQVLIGLGYVF